MCKLCMQGFVGTVLVFFLQFLFIDHLFHSLSCHCIAFCALALSLSLYLYLSVYFSLFRSLSLFDLLFSMILVRLQLLCVVLGFALSTYLSISMFVFSLSFVIRISRLSVRLLNCE